MSFKTVKYRIGEKVISLDRPLQVREIPMQTSSERGFIPSLKLRKHLCIDTDNEQKSLILDHESQFEHDFFLLLDHDPSCIDLQPQPIEFEYEATDGHIYKFYPDIWALFLVDGEIEQYLFEVNS